MASLPLLKEYRLLRRRMEFGREKKEGQTINVDLTPVTVPEGKTPPPPPPIPCTLGSVSATAAGLVAVKCPKCGSEDTSYRSECFNCGSVLR